MPIDIIYIFRRDAYQSKWFSSISQTNNLYLSAFAFINFVGHSFHRKPTCWTILVTVENDCGRGLKSCYLHCKFAWFAFWKLFANIENNHRNINLDGSKWQPIQPLHQILPSPTIPTVSGRHTHTHAHVHNSVCDRCLRDREWLMKFH